MGRKQAAPLYALAIIAGMSVLGIFIHAPLSASIKRAGNRRRSGALRFSFVVRKPVEQVFAYFANFENFPRFIGALHSVTDSGDGRSRWRARTSSGRRIEWDANTTKFVTNSVIAWKSVRNSPVNTEGVLRFMPEDNGTCVRIAIDYSVPDGPLVDALAALLRRRRVKTLEQDIRALEHASLSDASSAT